MLYGAEIDRAFHMRVIMLLSIYDYGKRNKLGR